MNLSCSFAVWGNQGGVRSASTPSCLFVASIARLLIMTFTMPLLSRIGVSRLLQGARLYHAACCEQSGPSTCQPAEKNLVRHFLAASGLAKRARAAHACDAMDKLTVVAHMLLTATPHVLSIVASSSTFGPMCRRSNVSQAFNQPVDAAAARRKEKMSLAQRVKTEKVSGGSILEHLFGRECTSAH
jgi:hypothetical protein